MDQKTGAKVGEDLINIMVKALKPVENIRISTDKKKLNVDLIHEFLSQTYWAKGIPRKTVEDAIKNSFCFGLYDKEQQIGFARVVTDFAVFGYLADVFIVKKRQGKGLGTKLVNAIMGHPRLKTLRRWHLVTKDAQNIYKHAGFKELADPEKHMEISRLNPYNTS